jgi:hypothetical protein
MFIAVLPRLGSRSRSLAILPARSFGRRHSSDDPGGLGRLLRGCLSLEGAQLVGWVFRARVGAARRRPRSIRPLSAAHGCCFQRRVPKSRQTSHRRFPRDARALGFTPRMLTSVSRPMALERCHLQPPICRRPSDAPSPAGSPGGAMSAGVGPRSLARPQVFTRKPRPAPPSRVNGLLVSLWPEAPSHSPRFRPNRRPDSAAPAIPSLSRRDPREAMESFCRFNRPPRHSACPQYLDCVPPRSFRNTAHRAAWTAPFPKPPIHRWSRPAKATAPNALLRTLTDPRSRALHDLPRRDRLRHPRHRRMTSGDGSSPASPPPIQALRPGAFPRRREDEPEPFPASHPANRAGDASFTPGSARP